MEASYSIKNKTKQKLFTLQLNIFSCWDCPSHLAWQVCLDFIPKNFIARWNCHGFKGHFFVITKVNIFQKLTDMTTEMTEVTQASVTSSGLQVEVDRKNLPLKMHLTWKMLEYLRRPNCTAWNQYVTVKSVLKFTWINWSTLFLHILLPLYSVTCMVVSKAAPYQFQRFLSLAYRKQKHKRKIRNTLIFQVVKNGVERTFKEGGICSFS